MWTESKKTARWTNHRIFWPLASRPPSVPIALRALMSSALAATNSRKSSKAACIAATGARAISRSTGKGKGEGCTCLDRTYCRLLILVRGCPRLSIHSPGLIVGYQVHAFAPVRRNLRTPQTRSTLPFKQTSRGGALYPRPRGKQNG